MLARKFVQFKRLRQRPIAQASIHYSLDTDSPRYYDRLDRFVIFWRPSFLAVDAVLLFQNASEVAQGLDVFNVHAKLSLFRHPDFPFVISSSRLVSERKSIGMFTSRYVTPEMCVNNFWICRPLKRQSKPRTELLLSISTPSQSCIGLEKCTNSHVRQ